MIDKLTFASLNVNGIQGAIKRRKIFGALRDHHVDIALLQETHSAPNNELIWQNEYGGNAFYSHGSTESRGVMILFRRGLVYQIKHICRDLDGRMLLIEVKVDNMVYCVCNIYGPNEDKPEFFTMVIGHLEDLDNRNVIWGGDFNFVLDVSVDRHRSTHNNVKSLEVVSSYTNDAELIDVWRMKHPHQKIFTWFRRRPLAMSRIDFFLLNAGLINIISKCDIVAMPMSDHSLITIELDCTQQPKGPGIWQFNTSHLNDLSFLKALNDHIDKTLIKIENCGTITKWKKLKNEMRNFCLAKSTEISKKQNQKVAKLYEKLKNLRNLCYSNPTSITDTQWQEYEDANIELDMYLEKRAMGAKTRCRTNWYQYGERSSKFFFSLEKANALKKRMTTLKLENGQTITDQDQIMNEQIEFYSKLYNRDPKVKFNMKLPDNVTKLSEDLKTELDLPLTKQELTNAVASMSNDKSPGIDGLPIEVYKILWPKIADTFYDSAIESLNSKHLLATMRTGLITIIPKKDKDPLYLKNWRSLTMLNSDYKILAKALTERINKTLPELISPDQTGFMKGRNIATNIRKVIEVIEYTKTNQIPAAIMSIDFQKCFDLISHQAIWKTLEYFNFGPNIIQWIQTMFSDFVSCIKYHGFTSKQIPIQRSVMQGSPLGPCLYLLCGQIVNILFKDNTNIKGINMFGLETLLSQFADDTDLFLLYEKLTFDNVISTLELIEHNIGLKVNYDKTTIYRIGSLAGSCARLYTARDFLWSNEPINILGVFVHNDMDSVFECNFVKIVHRIETILACWATRSLTLSGRVLVVNTLIASLFVYKLAVLGNVPYILIQKLEKMISEFLWNGKRPKITLAYLQLDRDQGGLRLVNLFEKQLSIKAQWVSLIRGDRFWSTIVYHYLDECIEDNIWNCNLHWDDVPQAIPNKSFWRQVLYAWCRFNYQDTLSFEEIHCSIIWYNSLIKIDDCVLMLHGAWRAGLRTVGQLFNVDGSCKTFLEITTRFGKIMSWFQYTQLISAIPTAWKSLMRNNAIDLIPCTKYEKLYSTCKITATVYSYLINNPKSILTKKARWENRLQTEIYDDSFIDLFHNINSLTICTKFRDFQFRLLHNAIVTNQKLYMWKIRQDNKCTFCDKDVETTLHLFCECPTVKTLWDDIELYIQSCANANAINVLEWNNENIMFNTVHPKPSHVINFVILITKQYIYRQRCTGGQLYTPLLIREIDNIQNTEFYIAKNKGKLKKHFIKWSQLHKNLIQTSDEITNEMDYIQLYLQHM